MRFNHNKLVRRVFFKLRASAFRIIPDRKYLEINYKFLTDRKLNLDNPKSFNEKLQWLKLYDRKPIYSTMVDKYEVKNYVASVIGDRYIIPTIGVYSRFEDINFDDLPDQFIIKCTHDSGGLVVCKDKTKLNIEEARNKISKCLKKNYYYHAREWPYKNVKPRIIIEKYLKEANGEDLMDYKFFTFNGKVRCFKVDFNRFTNHQANYYDREGKLLGFGETVCPPDFNKIIVMPKNLKKMITLAEKLSGDNPFLRVDFYNINSKIYFGEITLYPASGFGSFTTEEWDQRLGNWIKLPNKETEGGTNA